GGSPTGSASRRLAHVPAPLGHWRLRVTCQPAPSPHVEQRLTFEARRVCVQLWTAKARPGQSQADIGGRRPSEGWPSNGERQAVSSATRARGFVRALGAASASSYCTSAPAGGTTTPNPW